MKITPPRPKYVGPAKWHGAKNNKPIVRITIHATAGAEPGAKNAAENTVNYSKGTDRPSSYHYVADTSKSLQYVYDNTVAYHAPPNRHSLGYELCCSLSNQGKGHWDRADHIKMMSIAAKDIARLCLAYNIPIVKLSVAAMRRGAKGIGGHDTVRDAFGQTSHWDPGPYFPWKKFITLIQREADLLKAPKAKMSPERLTRGAAVDHALADLEKAAKNAAKKPARLRKIKASIDSLRTLHPAKVK